jgi:hypothetical protein
MPRALRNAFARLPACKHDRGTVTFLDARRSFHRAIESFR